MVSISLEKLQTSCQLGFALLWGWVAQGPMSGPQAIQAIFSVVIGDHLTTLTSFLTMISVFGARPSPWLKTHVLLLGPNPLDWPVCLEKSKSLPILSVLLEEADILFHVPAWLGRGT